MKMILRSLACVSALVVFGNAASAQVTYDPFEAPAPYGYRVPGGVLQPDETLGTSSTYQLLPTPYGYPPAVRVVQTCQYPDGWNATDFSRDLNGIPGGLEHACPLGPRVHRRHRAPY